MPGQTDAHVAVAQISENTGFLGFTLVFWLAFFQRCDKARPCSHNRTSFALSAASLSGVLQIFRSLRFQAARHAAARGPALGHCRRGRRPALARHSAGAGSRHRPAAAPGGPGPGTAHRSGSALMISGNHYQNHSCKRLLCGRYRPIWLHIQTAQTTGWPTAPLRTPGPHTTATPS